MPELIFAAWNRGWYLNFNPLTGSYAPRLIR